MTNCVCTEYGTLAEFITAVELVDDTKFLAAFVYKELGTDREKIILITKT